MPAPLVSVVIPVFNGEKYIADTVASVTAQTFADWELIVVDDGSTDTTLDRLRALPAHPHLHIITQPNQGASAARNTGLAAAQGAYIAFLDSDDCWHPQFLEHMLAALQPQPEAALAYAGWQYINTAGVPLPQAIVPQTADAHRVEQNLNWRNAILPSAVLTRRKTVSDLGGFDTAFSACEDWDMWLRLKTKGAFVPVPEVLMYYRAHAESKTDNLAVIEREQLRLNEKHLGPLIGPSGKWPVDRQRAVSHTYFTSALQYLRSAQTGPGVEKLQRAIALWPGLLNEREFYYELGCAYQPRGQRGTAQGLDLNKSVELIQAVLPHDEFQRRWPLACLELSQLSYMSGQFQLARYFALQALRQMPFSKKVNSLPAVIRALTPPTIWNALRRLRAGIA